MSARHKVFPGDLLISNNNNPEQVKTIVLVLSVTNGTYGSRIQHYVCFDKHVVNKQYYLPRSEHGFIAKYWIRIPRRP